MRGTWFLALVVATARGVAGVTDGAGCGASRATCGERARRFLLFIAYECLLVAVKVAYQLLRDTPPFEVKLQRKRVNFLGRKIVADEPDERKEDSDDEESDDEVRHPLIVHDRDPEQNLEALRDPSRYRQNLA